MIASAQENNKLHEIDTFIISQESYNFYNFKKFLS